MDYLTEYYKNQCQQLSSKKLQLENQVKVLRFKTFLIEKDGGMFTKSTSTNQSGELASYTPQTQAGVFDDLWQWIFGPANPTPGPGIAPGTPGGRSPGTPTPGPGRPRDTRPWRPGEKFRGRDPRPVEGNPPRAYPGTVVPPGPPAGVPPAKKYGNPPRTPIANPKQSLLDGKYYFLAQDGTVYRWSVTDGQWIRHVGETPFGQTYDGGFIPGTE